MKEKEVEMKRIIMLSVALVSVLILLCACGNTAPEAQEFTADGIKYELTSDWTFDEENMTFSNKNDDSVAYAVVTDEDIAGKCSGVEERRGMYAADGSDGIDLYDVTINGTEALLTVEPVNEIKDIYLFFYADGAEHAINYEPDFEAEDISEVTQELFDSIRF